jgi:probable DNA metabolism protein
LISLLYDGSLEGFLTAVFEAYERKFQVHSIRKEGNLMQNLFGESLFIEADKTKANRVWEGFKSKVTGIGTDYVLCALLSELPDVEDALLGFIKHVFSHPENVETDYSDLNVLQLERVSKMVHRERHRMKAFIRFQLTKDGIYYAAVDPDFNVLPILISHFKNRYADQHWLIYDLKRKYGIYYNLNTVETIHLEFNEGDIAVAFDEKEELYQQLWKDYFKSVNIASRKNMVLHIRHVPKRYWKYLTEKIPGKLL